jgi:hypothetical protein
MRFKAPYKIQKFMKRKGYKRGIMFFELRKQGESGSGLLADTILDGL